jgi:hypothetical protein
MTTSNQSRQLPIDECEEWICDTLGCSKDCGFEYIKDGNKEFLIFNTNDFFADAKALEKIRRLPAWNWFKCVHNGYTHIYGLVDICCKKISSLEKSSIDNIKCPPLSTDNYVFSQIVLTINTPSLDTSCVARELVFHFV